VHGPWYRIQAILAAAQLPSAESDFVTVLPAVLSAKQRGRPFMVGWLSRGAGAPLELITNAGPLTPADDDGPEGLLFPSGARGAAVGDEWLEFAHKLVWAPCPGRLAPPLVRSQTPGEHRPTLFESTLVTLMGRPFGWLVIAEPTQQIDHEVDAVGDKLSALKRFEESYQFGTLDVERAERRMAELESFREAGLWNVRVLAGAETPEELGQIAPVLVGSVDLADHPYRLQPGQQVLTLDEAVTVVPPVPENKIVGQEPAAPFAATAGALAALAGLPRREVPGLRVLDAGHFDVTSETDDQAAPSPIELGAILDGQDRKVGSFPVPLSTLNRHVFVTGSTGSGKSQTVRHLLEQLSRAGIPWLAIEPAKSEYAAMAGRVHELGQPVTVINPSDPDSVPLSVNPLAPEPGYPVQAHIDMVRALFQAAFDAEEPFPQIMAQALQQVYEDNRWDVALGGGLPGSPIEPAIPTLEQLQDTALRVIRDVGYGREIQANVEGFVDVRLRSLRIGSAGRFFEGGHPADIGQMLSGNVVLAIEDVANDEDKAFLMGTLIIRIVEHLRLRARSLTATGQRPQGLRHVFVIEEAHRLLRNRGDDRAGAHAVELFAGLLAEIRAYGEGIVVAEQIPTKLVPDVIKNTALKVVHRLPAADDRHIVGAAMNLDEHQSRHVVSLEPGVAAVFADGMDRPVRVRVPLGEGRERVMPGPTPAIRGRRSAACGSECRAVRACTLYELREADLLATEAESAPLRVWAEILVLAHVANRPMPAVPAELARRWADEPARRRECALATVLEESVERRAWALRTAYQPEELTAAVVDVARRLLDGAAGISGGAPGGTWVLPQIQWLHEMDKLFPYGQGAPDKHALAPPLDYVLPGLKPAPGAKLGHRLYALRRHPLSVELERNKPVARIAITGTDDGDAFADDLLVVAVGVEDERQLTHVGEPLGVDGWLESVLTWPDRFSGDAPVLEG
jgi:uncharacterized protein